MVSKKNYEKVSKEKKICAHPKFLTEGESLPQPSSYDVKVKGFILGHLECAVKGWFDAGESAAGVSGTGAVGQRGQLTLAPGVWLFEEGARVHDLQLLSSNMETV